MDGRPFDHSRIRPMSVCSPVSKGGSACPITRTRRVQTMKTSRSSMIALVVAAIMIVGALAHGALEAGTRSPASHSGPATPVTATAATVGATANSPAARPAAGSGLFGVTLGPPLTATHGDNDILVARGFAQPGGSE